MDIVQDLLKKEKEAKALTSVHKHLELKFDLGSLAAFDENELDKSKLNSKNYLIDLARDNTQLLINQLWKLPQQKNEEIIEAVLPKQTTILPRALPVPKAKELTKWERFAKEKGIQKKKKDKLKWDDILKKWVPLHGYKRAAAEKEKDWVIEVPGNADPYEDQFEKRQKEKSERVAKNEFQRLRNLAKTKNIKVPKTGLAPAVKSSSERLGAELTIARSSTASLGKFQAKLPKEKDAKNVKEFLPGNRKRKNPHLNFSDEKVKSLQLLDTILNKKPKLNLDHAVDKEISSMNVAENTKKQPKKNKKSGGKTKKGSKGGKFRGPQVNRGTGGKNSKARVKTQKGRKRR